MFLWIREYMMATDLTGKRPRLFNGQTELRLVA